MERKEMAKIRLLHTLRKLNKAADEFNAIWAKIHKSLEDSQKKAA